MSDVFHELELLADRAEARLPGFLRYDVVGDPASWVQHGLVCACVTLVGMWLSFWMLGDVHPGMRLFGAGAALYYLVREIIQAIAHAVLDGFGSFIWIRRRKDGGLLVGWGLDGIGDFAGPLLVFWLSR